MDGIKESSKDIASPRSGAHTYQRDGCFEHSCERNTKIYKEIFQPQGVFGRNFFVFFLRESREKWYEIDSLPSFFNRFFFSFPSGAGVNFPYVAPPLLSSLWYFRLGDGHLVFLVVILGEPKSLKLSSDAEILTETGRATVGRVRAMRESLDFVDAAR